MQIADALQVRDSADALPGSAHSNGEQRELLDALRREVAAGFLYTHSRANANTSRILEATSFLYALIELLEERGIVTIAEVDQRKVTVVERITKRFLEKGMGVHMQEPGHDKYSIDGAAASVDCEHRVHLCKAACCRLWFPLSRQDIDERVVRWDLEFPYLIDQDEDRYCRHLDRGACRCTIYDKRPLPCRTYECRNDERIWLDFESRVINPDLKSLFQMQELENTSYVQE
jgi:hypothetical protein